MQSSILLFYKLQEGYRASGEYESTLATLKWATDYLLKCHTETNQIFAQVIHFLRK